MRSVIISGGGTGGHIFPALAIADELRRRHPACRILFVGAAGRMEMERVPAAGYPIEGLPVRGLQRALTLRNLWLNAQLPFQVLGSLLQARTILRRERPQVAVGVGGYASGPLLAAARLAGLPYVIQEQNSHAGLTNKALASGAAAICTAWPGMERYFPADRITLTGNPVRAGYAAADLAPLHAEALAYFGLQPGQPVVLVTGGSLGARTLNQALEAGVDKLLAAGLQVIWQTGKAWAAQEPAQASHTDNLPVVAKNLASVHRSPGLWRSAFIGRMELAYAAADVVVARAGALTISELCLTGRPAILVPSPHVAEDHQTRNAQALATVGAAEMIADSAATTALIPAVLALVADTARRLDYCQKISKLAQPMATALIVDQIEQVAARQAAL